MAQSASALYYGNRNTRGVPDEVKLLLTPHLSYQPPKTVNVKSIGLENTSFINRTVVYYAREAGVLNASPETKRRSEEGHRLIEDFVFNILQHGLDKFRVDKSCIKGCGGFHETPYNVKITDCDFNVILNIPQDYVNFSHECNRENDAPNRAKKRRYFKGTFAEKARRDPDFTEKWHCKNMDCTHDEPTLKCPLALDASVIQQQFFHAIQKGLRYMYEIPEESSVVVGHPYCFMAGPAVTIALKVADHINYNLSDYITIDLALAIPSILDCLQCPSLRESDEFLPRVVPSGHFWRISFSERETQIIKDSSGAALAIYSAAKAIRDEIAPTFPTYPIKQSFLHQRSLIEDKIAESEHKFWVLAPCVMMIFDYITECTTKNKFNNFHQKDDPVLETSDASYEQSKLFKLYMPEQNDMYKYKGFSHMVVMVLFIAYNVLFGLIRNWMFFTYPNDHNIALALTIDVTCVTIILSCAIWFICIVSYRGKHGLFGKFYGRVIKRKILLYSILTFLPGCMGVAALYLWSTQTENTYTLQQFLGNQSSPLMQTNNTDTLQQFLGNQSSPLMQANNTDTLPKFLGYSSLSVSIIFVLLVTAEVVLFRIAARKYLSRYFYEFVFSEQILLRYTSRDNEYMIHERASDHGIPIRDQNVNYVV